MSVLQSSTPAVTITNRRLPPFRQRRAGFVANLLSLFYGNEEETTLLRDEVGGIESYGGRLIPILNLLFRDGPCDLVLEEAPDPALLAYYADQLELSLPKLHILPHGDYVAIGERLSREEPLSTLSPVPESLRDRQLESLDGYVTDPVLQTLAGYCGTQTLSTLEGSRRGNNKWLLHSHLEACGLPVFETVMATHPGEVAPGLQALRERGFQRAVIKSQVGASGIGIQQLSTDDPSPEVADLLFYEGPCMLQGWLQVGHEGITAIQSPSVQLYLDEEAGVFLYDITEQILSHDSVHEGNVSPPPDLHGGRDTEAQLYEQAGVAATWLFEQGYRGTASVDFLLAIHDAETASRPYVCEINARVTGATYPSILARHFMPDGAWLMRNLKFECPQPAQHLLNLLKENDHLYGPGRPGGILPINVNTNAEGLVEKGQFLCLGATVGACRDFLLCGERELPIDWAYVRD